VVMKGVFLHILSGLRRLLVCGCRRRRFACFLPFSPLALLPTLCLSLTPPPCRRWMLIFLSDAPCLEAVVFLFFGRASLAWIRRDSVSRAAHSSPSDEKPPYGRPQALPSPTSFFPCFPFLLRSLCGISVPPRAPVRVHQGLVL